MSTIKPISPDQIDELAVKELPDDVIKAWNQLIIEKWDGRSANILQKDAAAKIALAMDISTSLVYEKGYLDIEKVFANAGWLVDYDRPIYYAGEDFEPNYTFRKP